MIVTPREVVINHFHLPCGLGGSAKGMNNGEARVGHLRMKPRCIGGIDIDPAAIRDFERAAKARGTVLDLMDFEQYVAFHGKLPPPGWREAVPDDLRRAVDYRHPHIGFMSSPCKGYSGLLPEKSSRSPKYQALNELALRIVWLTFEAFKDDPIELIAFENVPRIAVRGRALLDRIEALASRYGYAFAETVHDCGEIGDLAQSRKRLLLMLRHIEKVPPFLYEPRKHVLRGVGEVLSQLPMPLSGRGGPMHRIPALQRKTWERLAFVKPGSDWRSLNNLRVVDGVLADYALVPERTYFNDALGVVDWQEPAGVITGNARPATGRYSVGDVRIDGHEKSAQLGVSEWAQPAPVVTGKMFVGGGRHAIADPRVETVRYNHVYRVVPFDSAAPAVTSANGGTGSAVADPRMPHDRQWGALGVVDWTKPAGTIIGFHAPGQGVCSVADPRMLDARNGRNGVLDWDEPSGAIAGESLPSNGAFAIGDPRTGWPAGSHESKLAVREWEQHAKAVTGSQQVGSGAQSIADPRIESLKGDREHYQTAGCYGVVPWDAPSGAVSGAGQHDNGRNSVGDPRPFELPAMNKNLVMVIRSIYGTWNRPFTTLELAALQGLVDLSGDLDQFCLDGKSDSAWRERIGNAVPSGAARGMMNVMGTTLLLAMSGETFQLNDVPIWVQPLAIALSVKPEAIS